MSSVEVSSHLVHQRSALTREGDNEGEITDLTLHFRFSTQLIKPAQPVNLSFQRCYLLFDAADFIRSPHFHLLQLLELPFLLLHYCVKTANTA